MVTELILYKTRDCLISFSCVFIIYRIPVLIDVICFAHFISNRTMLTLIDFITGISSGGVLGDDWYEVSLQWITFYLWKCLNKSIVYMFEQHIAICLNDEI